jgi:hypothetical protein
MPELVDHLSRLKTVSLAASAGTFVTWIFFYFETPDAPLGKSGTLVVYGAWFILIFLVQSVWRTVFPKKSPSRKEV